MPNRGGGMPNPLTWAHHSCLITHTVAHTADPTKYAHHRYFWLQGGGGGLPNPFDMGKLMESVKKAQQMVQVETQRVQAELEA